MVRTCAECVAVRDVCYTILCFLRLCLWRSIAKHRLIGGFLQTMIDLYYKVLTTRYAQFSGRASRREYWSFYLVNSIIAGVLARFDLFVYYDGSIDRAADEFLLNLISLFPTSILYLLLTLLPFLSLNARRLHDIGRSGWWFLMFFVPFIGILIWLFWMIKPSDDGDNAYGPPGEALV